MAKLSGEEDGNLRAFAMEWLEHRTHDGTLPLHNDNFGEFEYLGKYRALRNPQMGIHKPKDMDAALSITTKYTAPGDERPYADEIGHDGLPRYNWDKGGRDFYTQASLRLAMKQQLPLIWFWGIGESLYKAIFPVYLIDEEEHLQQFVVAIDGLQGPTWLRGATNEVSRRYHLRKTKERLHQPIFRSMVLRAYKSRCAICKLGHASLLDAAHIVGDRDEKGVAAVRNGMTLCKLHHAAYDSGILGIGPDYRLSIREDILTEVDGPILEFGLKKIHGTPLVNVPDNQEEKPDPSLLEIHFEQFKARKAPPTLTSDFIFPQQ